jgi:hypothetical protein
MPYLVCENAVSTNRVLRHAQQPDRKIGIEINGGQATKRQKQLSGYPYEAGNQIESGQA